MLSSFRLTTWTFHGWRSNEDWEASIISRWAKWCQNDEFVIFHFWVFIVLSILNSPFEEWLICQFEVTRSLIFDNSSTHAYKSLITITQHGNNAQVVPLGLAELASLLIMLSRAWSESMMRDLWSCYLKMLSCDNAQVVPLGLTELAPLLMGTPAAEVWRAVGQLVIAMIIQKIQ